jgi:Protein of unknown function (DUF1566)
MLASRKVQLATRFKSDYLTSTGMGIHAIDMVQPPGIGRDIYTTPDAPQTYTFNDATDYAATLNRQKHLGHDDWRVPTKEELRVLFSNRAVIGGFDEGGSDPVGWYWSSTQDEYDLGAWVQRFSDGTQLVSGKVIRVSLRLVR